MIYAPTVRLDELPILCKTLSEVGKRMAKVREVQQKKINGGDVFEYKKLSKTERKRNYMRLKRAKFNKKTAENLAIKHFMATGEKVTIAPDISKKSKTLSFYILKPK